MCKYLRKTMEKTTIIAVFVLMIAGHVISENNDILACCPSSHYFLYLADHVCWEPQNNSTTPTRFGNDCIKTIKLYKFTTKNAKVEVQHSDLHKASYDSSLACTGTLSIDMNLTKVVPIALLCYKNEVNDGNTLGYCMIVSVVFLSITAIIYSLFSELRDLFGKSIINFCTCLAIGMGILTIMKLMAFQDMAMCATRGFLAYFFMMTSFFWTNSISIQLLRYTRGVCTVDYGWREFRWYVLYSWGVPAILIMCMAIVNYHPGEHQRPGIGLSHCWFLSKKQQWYYMYSVMSILILVNIGLFIYISTIVWRRSFSSCHAKTLKFRLIMTIRLFVVMGLPWIFEMINPSSESHIILYILDVFNSLQGILLFLVLVVFRKRVIRVLYKRGWLPYCSGLVERCLAVGDDTEDNVIQHTEVPTFERQSPNK